MGLLDNLGKGASGMLRGYNAGVVLQLVGMPAFFVTYDVVKKRRMGGGTASPPT